MALTRSFVVKGTNLPLFKEASIFSSTAKFSTASISAPENSGDFLANNSTSISPFGFDVYNKPIEVIASIQSFI